MNSTEGSLHGKLDNSAAGEAARVTPKPRDAISAIFRPLRPNRTLLIKQEMTDLEDLFTCSKVVVFFF